MLYHTTPDLAARFKADGIIYGVSVGRRQPMHRVHLDCLKEILTHGLKLICVHGSVNPPDSPFYDPLANPLSLPELEEQIRRVLPGEEVIHLALADRGDAALWSQDLAALLGDKLPSAVMHYRRKSGDEAAGEGRIKPLSQTEEQLMALGLSVWESQNPHLADDDVHGSALRTMDLRHLTPQQESQFADAAYIRALAEAARRAQPAEGPLTMQEISRTRKG